jgi:hypothetical protein
VSISNCEEQRRRSPRASKKAAKKDLYFSIKNPYEDSPAFAENPDA